MKATGWLNIRCKQYGLQVNKRHSSGHSLIMMKLKKRLSDSERLFFPLPKFIFLFSILLQVTHFICSIYEHKSGSTLLWYSSWPLWRQEKELKEDWKLLSSSYLQKLSSSKVEKQERSAVSACTWFCLQGKCSPNAVVYNSSDPPKRLSESVITAASQSSHCRGNKSLSTQGVT